MLLEDVVTGCQIQSETSGAKKLYQQQVTEHTGDWPALEWPALHPLRVREVNSWWEGKLLFRPSLQQGTGAIPRLLVKTRVRSCEPEENAALH